MQNKMSSAGLRVRTQVRAGKPTIYGTDWCGFTQKQKDAFDAKGIQYNYVNCDGGKCPKDVTAFPHVTGYEGKAWTGFRAV